MSRVFFTDRDLGTQFADILAEAGLTVERHRNHFSHDCPDDVWLAGVGKKGWIAITHNSRIRYTPNELRAVVEHSVALLVVVGKAKYADLACSFVNSRHRIDAFIARHDPPYIAKVYRGSASELARRANAAGRIELWYPPLAEGGTRSR